MAQRLYGVSQKEWAEWLREQGEPSFRLQQLIEWLYIKKRPIEKMGTLSKKLREQLQASFQEQSLSLVSRIESNDKETTKFLWKLSDGYQIESVLIRAPQRRTLCLSSQVGCPGRCAFCASGKKGFIRNLETAEIVEQFIQVSMLLKEEESSVSHLVFMGMGEPFENEEAVKRAISLFQGAALISQRRITISTVGIISKIRRYADEEGAVAQLALSLHAPNQQIRQQLIPYSRQNPFEALLEAMLYFAHRTGRNISYEYILIEGINDRPEDAVELSRAIKDHPCSVNLIPYNPVAGLLWRRPSREAIERFQSILQKAAIVVTRRYTKGIDIAASCGQLALQPISPA